MNDWSTRATHIEVDAEPRYWEDAVVDGVVDDDGTLIPGREGDAWKVRIELATGRIEQWPDDVTATIHYKVCDQGLYWLADADGRRLARWRGHYVPAAFLNQGGGSGDYIVMDVDGRGVIAGYRRPDIDPDRWTAI